MELQILINKFKEAVDSIKIEPEHVDYSILNHHLNLLDRIALVENSSLTVFDMFQKKYVFVRSRFKDSLGYDEQKAKEEGFSYFFSLMHPEDLPMVIDTSTRALRFMNQLSSAEKQNYKSVFEYRLKDSSGKYIRFLQQEATLELDLKGTIWLILILLDVCPNQQDAKVFQRSLIDIRTGKPVLFSTDDKNVEYILSKREIEVLGFLNKGLQSKEIAERLYLSVNTVNNHRQNIIRKMGLNNTSEAISYARKIGMI